MAKRSLLTFLILLFCLPIAGLAETYKAGSIEISDPVARATLPGAAVSGGYMRIQNDGSEPDRLIFVEVEFAGKTELHEMAMDNGIMKMRHLPNGIDIPAGEATILEPGGYHIMFMMLKNPLVEGEEWPGKLVFEKAGSIDVVFQVQSTKTIKSKEHSGHSGH